MACCQVGYRQINNLVQDCSISSALAMGILLFCTKHDDKDYNELQVTISLFKLRLLIGLATKPK